MAQMKLAIVDIDPFIHGDEVARKRVARAFGEAFETTGFAVIVGHGVPEPLAAGLYDTLTGFFAEPYRREVPLHPAGEGQGSRLPADRHRERRQDADRRDPAGPLRGAGLHARRTARRCPVRGPISGRRSPGRFAASSPTGRGRWWRSPTASPACRPWRSTFRRATSPRPIATRRWCSASSTTPTRSSRRFPANCATASITTTAPSPSSARTRPPAGLQIKDADGAWKEAGVVPGSFVINVGDLMARWTNNRWRSTLHRVSNPDRGLTGSTRRLSMVAFTGPNEQWEVACLPSCTDAEHPPLFEPITAGEYVRAKIAASMELHPGT